MQKKGLLALALGLVIFSACSSDEDVVVKTNGNEGSAISSSSTALSYVSIYEDAACKTPLVENAPLTDEITAINLSVNYGIDTVYVEYPTANGNKVMAKALPTQANSKKLNADPGSVAYFETESSKYVTLEIEKPENAVKNYVTNADGFTNYHSSGVVMFEDTWPSKTNVDTIGANGDAFAFSDYNDFVVDYDLEATVNDAADPNQLWKEDLKVVMHIRAMGGGNTQSFGLLLEGLDKSYISDDVDVKLTLGNYGEPIGDGLTAEVQWQDQTPIIYINNTQKLLNKSYMGSNGLQVVKNKRPGASNITLYNIYNDNTLNVGKGLFTVTVTFRGIEGSSSEERAAQIENFKNAVINTNLQNFFITNYIGGKTYETHLPGYKPTASYTTVETDKNVTPTGYKAVEKSADDPYLAANGNVWGIKTPVLTRHTTLNSTFSIAYPLYKVWREDPSSTEAAKWYYPENRNNTLDYTAIFAATGKFPFKYIIEEW